MPKYKSNGKKHYLLEDSATEPFPPHWRSDNNKQQTIWCPVACTTVAAGFGDDLILKAKMRWNLEPMRNNTSKFLNRTWILPSSQACSISSQLRLRLWTTSETSDWSPQLAITGAWPSVSTPVGTSSFPGFRSKFGMTCKNEDNKPLPQKQIHNVD